MNSETLVIEIEQSNKDGLLSVARIEYPNLTNAMANKLNLAFMRGLIDAAEALAAHKAVNEHR